MTKLKIKGPIVSDDIKWIYDEFEMEATSPKDIIQNLPENGDVELLINSYGGSVDSANEIYTELRGHPGKVTVEVVMAGSAASVIAMAGDTVKISPVGQIMIHNSSTYSEGDYRDMDKTSEILKKTNESIAQAYMLKTGLDKDMLLELMDEETWMTAQDAIDYGFADEMMFEEETERPVLVANAGYMLPQEVINRMTKEKQNKTPKAKSFADWLF